MEKILRTDSRNTDFLRLVALLDADLANRDGEDHAFYAQFNKTSMITHCIVCYDGDVAVACGAFKSIDDHTVEIKRMYVLPQARRSGYAQLVLKSLEEWAAEIGMKHCILETGKMQPEAIQLYLKSNYTIIPNYGQYEGIENSVCFRKIITPA
jgi:putative acetyltransferase